jgi:hypothetical protein
VWWIAILAILVVGVSVGGLWNYFRSRRPNAPLQEDSAVDGRARDGEDNCVMITCRSNVVSVTPRAVDMLVDAAPSSVTGRTRRGEDARFQLIEDSSVALHSALKIEHDCHEVADLTLRQLHSAKCALPDDTVPLPGITGSDAMMNCHI